MFIDVFIHMSFVRVKHCFSAQKSAYNDPLLLCFILLLCFQLALFCCFACCCYTTCMLTSLYTISRTHYKDFKKLSFIGLIVHLDEVLLFLKSAYNDSLLFYSYSCHVSFAQLVLHCFFLNLVVYLKLYHLNIWISMLYPNLCFLSLHE